MPENYVKLEIEIETLEGKIYKQPNCRIKTTAEGNVMCLVLEEGRWKGVRGKIYIKDFVLRKEYYFSRNGMKNRIPMWLINLFKVKI